MVPVPTTPTETTPTQSPPRDPSARQVFEILVHEHSGMLLAFLRAQLREATAVDDLFQDVMLTAWRKLGSYDRSRPFGPWLRGIAVRLVRKERARRPREDFLSEPETAAALEQHFARIEPGSDGLDETYRQLWLCLERLPERLRGAVEAVYRRGLRITEAASQLDVSLEAVKKRLQRGRALLSECLQSTTEVRP